MAETDLSEQHIQQLLKDAECRMRSNKDVIHNCDNTSLEKLKHSISTIAPSNQIEPYIVNIKNIPKVNPSHLVSDHAKASSTVVRVVDDPVMLKIKALDEKKATAGPDWFNLPRTDLTPELKRDLQILRMRDVLDPKRHYKKDNTREKFPEFSQVGTIIEGPTEYFSARLSNKDRKRTLAEEVLENEKASGRFKKKYAEVQALKTSGKKAHYKRVVSMRKRSKILDP
ncbi:rRNA-processing protein fcf2 [Golovinomyces cichoracearum]|uniref:rRNA-processing protein fcf2 n=1 Tax=Golovinomyces cichoracearum TaxID=62708 RepID=A0A420J134_9PEZI|nr:rRNA-processing protein fcf2 [Golovinomyces cichoracearum]